MHKKGIVRIIEAAIAVFILIGFVSFVLINQVQKPNIRDSAARINHQILTEIADNYTLRGNVLQGSLAEINSAVEKRLAPFPLGFSISNCSAIESCPCISCPPDKEIYADDVIITTNLSDYAPKKLALFTWLQ